MYSHRNGENMPPTVRGLYWYEGEYKEDIADPNVFHRLYTISENVNERGKDKWWAFKWNGHPQDRAKNTHEMSGKWWGPIVLPWNEAE